MLREMPQMGQQSMGNLAGLYPGLVSSQGVGLLRADDYFNLQVG
jgi:hypothetical protein